MNEKIKLFMHGELGGFENPRRFVKPEGLIKDSHLILKLYNMYSQNEQNPVDESKRFLLEKMEYGEIETLSGIGFAILSKDMLNINRWDRDCPIVIKNDLWSYEPKKGLLKSIEKCDVNKIGPYCIWELGIVNHEKNSWMKYLNSKMKREDELEYLKSVIEGDLK